MNVKILFANGFRATKALNKLAEDPRIQEIEGYGADEGRVFIHLMPGYKFSGYDSVSASVGSIEEINYKKGLIVLTNSNTGKN